MRFDRRKTYPLNDRKDESYARRIADFLPFITKIPYRKGGVVKVTPGLPINVMATKYWSPALYKFMWNRFTSGGVGPAGGSTPATLPTDEPPPPSGNMDFVSRWKTKFLNPSITLPIHGNGTYDFEVFWGDGTSSIVTDSADIPSYTHAYVEPGVYQITIKGQYDGFIFNSNSASDTLLEISNFGSLRFLPNPFGGGDNFNNAFNMRVTATDVLDTSLLTELSSIFSGCSSIKNVNITGMEVGKTGSLSMFNGCSSLESIDVSGWDVSNFTSVANMFAGCSLLTSTGASQWTDMLNMENIDGFYANAYLMEETDLSGWQFSNKLTSIRLLFSNIEATSPKICSGPGWDMSGVTDIVGVFQNYKAGIIDCSGWDLSSCTMAGSFANSSTITDILQITGIDTWTNLGAAGPVDMSSFLNGCQQLTSFTSPWPYVVPVSNAASMFGIARAVVSIDLSGFDFSALTNTTSMFSHTNALVSINFGPAWSTTLIENMNSMFANSYTIDKSTLVPLIQNWDIPALSNAGSMFNSDIAEDIVLTTAQYDAILSLASGWASQVTMPGVQFGAQKTKYTPGGDAEAGRNALLANGWEIFDAGPVPPQLSPEAQLVVDRMTDPLSDIELGGLAAFVDGLVAAGMWVLMGDFYCHVLSGANALIGWKQSMGVNTNATFGSDGMILNGVDAFIDNGVLLADLGIDVADSLYGGYLHSWTPFNDQDNVPFSFGASSNYMMMRAQTLNNKIEYYHGSNVLELISGKTYLDKTNYTSVREDAANMSLYEGGVQISTVAVASVANPEQTWKIGRFSPAQSYGGVISTSYAAKAVGFNLSTYLSLELTLLQTLGVAT